MAVYLFDPISAMWKKFVEFTNRVDLFVRLGVYHVVKGYFYHTKLYLWILTL